MEWERPLFLELVTLNSCHGNDASSDNWGDIPIRMPIGSRLISVDVVTLDSAGSTTYVVELNKSTLAGPIVHFGTVTLGAGALGVTHTLITLPGTEIVAPDVSYAVRVGSFKNSLNAFCQVTVVYDSRP
jgi:hypothetical protein